MKQRVRVALSHGLENAQPVLEFNGARIATKVVRFHRRLIGIRVGAALPPLATVRLLFPMADEVFVVIDGRVKRQQSGVRSCNIFVSIHCVWTAGGRDLLTAFLRDVLEMTKSGKRLPLREKAGRHFFDLAPRKAPAPTHGSSGDPTDDAWAEFGGGDWGPDPARKLEQTAKKALEEREQARQQQRKRPRRSPGVSMRDHVPVTAAIPRDQAPAKEPTPPVDKDANTRIEPRARAATNLLVRFDGRASECLVRDVSEGGLCLIVYGPEPSLGAELRMTHPVKTKRGVVGLPLRGHVVWAVPEEGEDAFMVGIELAWTALPDARWEKYVAHRKRKRPPTAADPLTSSTRLAGPYERQRVKQSRTIPPPRSERGAVRALTADTAAASPHAGRRATPSPGDVAPVPDPREAFGSQEIEVEKHESGSRAAPAASSSGSSSRATAVQVPVPRALRGERSTPAALNAPTTVDGPRTAKDLSPDTEVEGPDAPDTEPVQGVDGPVPSRHPEVPSLYETVSALDFAALLGEDSVDDAYADESYDEEAYEDDGSYDESFGEEFDE